MVALLVRVTRNRWPKSQMLFSGQDNVQRKQLKLSPAKNLAVQFSSDEQNTFLPLRWTPFYAGFSAA